MALWLWIKGKRDGGSAAKKGVLVAVGSKHGGRGMLLQAEDKEGRKRG